MTNLTAARQAADRLEQQHNDRPADIGIDLDLVTILNIFRELDRAAQWRDISEAPTSGKWLLLFWPDVTDEVAFAGYCLDGVWHAAPSGDTWDSQPTHFQELPSLPKGSS
jgi:hypothetical protein